MAGMEAWNRTDLESHVVRCRRALSRIRGQNAERQRGHRALAQGHHHDVTHDHGRRAQLARGLEVALAAAGLDVEADEERLSRTAPEAGHEGGAAVDEGARDGARGQGGAPGEMAVAAVERV